MKKRFLVLAMALCMVFALGFAFAEGTNETPSDETEKVYVQAEHDDVCVAEGITGKDQWELCTNPEHTFEPTCEEKGAQCYLCPLCTKCVHTEEIPATGHAWVDVEKLEATCEENGHEAYAYCANTLDEEGNPTEFAVKNEAGEYEKVEAITVLPAREHIKDGELYKIPADPNWDPSTLPCGVRVSLDAICGYEDCGVVLTEKIDIMFDHEWIPADEVAAACEETGIAAHEFCKREVNGAPCGAVKFNGSVYADLEEALAAEEALTLEALGHDLYAVNGTPGACEEAATSDHVACTRCDHTEGLLELPAPGHEYTIFLPEIPATCTEKGLAAAWECSVCGQLAENVVTDAGNVAGEKIDARAEIAPLEHKLPTGAEAWKTILGVAATCETDGVAAHRVCTLCGKIQYNGYEYSEEIGQELVVIPAHGHIDEDGYERNVANAAEREGTPEALYTEAQMIAEGYLVIEVEDRERPAADPTCTETGWISTLYCPWCAEDGKITVRREGEEIPALGHDWELTKKGVMPGCVTTGISDEWTCKRCGEVEGNEAIAPLGHAIAYFEAKLPDCYEGGWVGFHYCTRTNKDAQGNPEKCTYAWVSADDAFGIPGATQRPCELVVDFDDEGNVIIPEYVKIAAYNHGYAADIDTEDEYIASESEYVTSVEAVAPTCTENGILGDGLWCELCESYVIVPTVDPALGHDWSAIVPEKAATCLEDGYLAHQLCNREDCLVGQIVDADGKPVKEFTCTLDADKNEVLPAEVILTALGHKEAPGVGTEPTCTEKGKTAGIFCERCGMAIKAQEEIPALGHDMSIVIAKVEPWCTTEGVKEYHLCTRCNVGEIVDDEGRVESEFTYDVVEGEVVLNDATKAALAIPALGHLYNGYVAQLDPTCFEDGHEEGLRCSRCVPAYADGKNDAWLIYPSIIVTKGHPEEFVHFVLGTDPCCDEMDDADRFFSFNYCTKCSYGWLEPNFEYDTSFVGPFQVELDEELNLVAIPEEAKWEQLPHDFYEYTDRAPTCLDDGVVTDKLCKYCGYKEAGAVRPALGHSWEKVEKIAPTCTEDGAVEAFKCTVCGQWAELTEEATFDYEDVDGTYIYITEETRTVIPATGHNMVHVNAVEPTCTEDGHEDGKICANGCGEREGAKVLEALGHDVTGVEWTVVTDEDGTSMKIKRCKRCNEIAEFQAIDQPSLGKLGDVDNNGRVNLTDALWILEYYVGNNPSPFIEELADYNQDGKIDTFDALAIVIAWTGA